MNLIRFYILAALAGCAVISSDRVPGWPELAIVEHHVSEAQMRERCAKYVGPLDFPMACAEFDFGKKRCDLWFSKDFPPSAAIIEHERMHCRGHDHIGGTTMAGML